MARVQQFAEGSRRRHGRGGRDGRRRPVGAGPVHHRAAAGHGLAARGAAARAAAASASSEPEESRAEAEVRRTGTVSPLDIEVQKQKVQALYEDWKDKPARPTRARGSRRRWASCSATPRSSPTRRWPARARKRCRSIKDAVDAGPDRRLPRDPGPRAREGAADAGPAGRAAGRCARRGDRQGAARHLPRGGGRGPRHHREQPRDVPRCAARPRGAHHDPPRLPHAQGQRTHGRAHGAGRDGLAVRAGDEQVAQGREARDARICSPSSISRANRSGAGWESSSRAAPRAIEGAEIIRQAEALKSDQKVAPRGTAPRPAPPPPAASPCRESPWRSISPRWLPSRRRPALRSPNPTPARPPAPAFDFESLDLGAAPVAAEPAAAPVARWNRESPTRRRRRRCPTSRSSSMAAPEPAIVEEAPAEPPGRSARPGGRGDRSRSAARCFPPRSSRSTSARPSSTSPC